MHISELQTPAILIDIDVMERNLARTAAYAREHGFRLRPHTKTHKIPALARRQMELGAVGVTVAKVSEAEVMLRAEPPDLLVAYPVLGRSKLDRLAAVARQTRVTVALDSAEAARQLSEAASAASLKFGVLVEADVGLGRMGVQPGRELVELARRVDQMPGLALRGIAFYPGHIKALDEEGLKAIGELAGLMAGAVDDFRAAGLPCEIVSGGSTPALFHSHRIAGMNEIRPGTYIFNDRNTAACGGCGLDDCAASIVATVVSTAHRDRLIVDGGSKTFSSDRLVTTGEATFGVVTEAPEARFVKMNEEHGFIDLPGASGRFRVGDTLRIIPNHICVAMNLHEQVYAIRGEEVVDTWRVEGRGKLQ